ncbi:MAG: hypothetical protein HXX20_00625 [Chloroflexi bacterium]|nr:hypothetical protein [Chloroflexota bacterium]
MPNSSSKRQRKRPLGQRTLPQRPDLPPVSNNKEKAEDHSLPGLLGWLIRNRRLLGWIELIVAIFLLWLAIVGFLGGTLFLPFAFGLIGLYFFYAYIQHNLGVNLGKTGTILNLVLLLGALVCAILSVVNKENISS